MRFSPPCERMIVQVSSRNLILTSFPLPGIDYYGVKTGTGLVKIAQLEKITPGTAWRGLSDCTTGMDICADLFQQKAKICCMFVLIDREVV